MKVFIGSSSESLPVAKLIMDMLYEEGIEPIPWWRDDVFAFGKTYIESLHDLLAKADAGVMIFSEDDKTYQRGEEYRSVRDNTLLEYGLFSGKLGRSNVAVIKHKKPKIPSDLWGMHPITLKGEADDVDFKERNGNQIRKWVKQIKEVGSKDIEKSIDKKFRSIFKKLKNDHPGLKDDLEILEQVTVSAFPDSQKIDYITDGLIHSITRIYLNGCNAIYALDVIGPNGWLSPSTFRYLAPQLKRYMRKNIAQNVWNLKVSQTIESAIHKSVSNAKRIGLIESYTKFDDPEDFEWSSGDAQMEYVRILLWEKEELLSPFAESVIAIHEAFHVPLFYIEKKKESGERDNDYILFNQKKKVLGLIGKKKNNYNTQEISKRLNGHFKKEFMNYLTDENILLAVDARQLIKEGHKF